MKLLIILILIVNLQADMCWNTDRHEWVEFNWLKNPTLDSNSVDSELKYMFTYPTTRVSFSCHYTGEPDDGYR